MDKIPPVRKQYAFLVRACWHYCRERRPLMLLIYVLFFCANICVMVTPWVVGQLVNTLQTGGPAVMSGALYWLVLYLGMIFLFWAFHGPARVIERRLAFRVRQNFNLHYYDIVSRMPVRWHQDHHSGGTINRVQKAAGSMFEFAQWQFIFIETQVQTVAVFVALALLDWRVSLALIVFTAVMFFVLSRFDRVIMKKLHAVNEGEHKFSSDNFDFISNIYSIITFNLAGRTTARLRQRMEDFYKPYHEEVILNEVKWCLVTVLSVVSHFAVLLFYIWHHLQPGQVLMLGTVVALFQYMQRLDIVLTQVAANYLTLVRCYTNVSAVEPIDRDFGKEGIVDDNLPDLRVTGGDIRFEAVTFSYNSRNSVFRDLSLHIQPGQKVGLIGPSGAGKTTLVNLLLRFNSRERLGISIDRQNIYDVNAASLRRHIGIIPQDTSLFQDTLMENIRYGRTEAAEDDILEAARLAHAHEFIEALPDGYNTLVGERGVKLSGGQRQRIAIARAILKNAPILVLDEATSALDSESEKAIQDSLARLMQGKTVIAIAHRLSTIAHLDRLVVMDKGRIVEDGPHAELLRRRGLYAHLWAMQSGGFIGAGDEKAA